MTHPIPNAATRASPLACGGEGQGEGVSPQTRPLLFCTPFLAALLLTTATQAQVIPTGTPAADILLSQAITEHRVFLTCSALDPATHAQITQNWQRDVTEAAAILTANKVPPEAIAAFTTAADPANLTPAEDTPWAEVKGLCDTHPDWQQRYYQFNLILLDLKLPGAFQ
ncbi:MAG: hypothetical protein V4753_10460 [Pseudomonadota bacterium]